MPLAAIPVRQPYTLDLAAKQSIRVGWQFAADTSLEPVLSGGDSSYLPDSAGFIVNSIPAANYRGKIFRGIFMDCVGSVTQNGNIIGEAQGDDGLGWVQFYLSAVVAGDFAKTGVRIPASRARFYYNNTALVTATLSWACFLRSI